MLIMNHIYTVLKGILGINNQNFISDVIVAKYMISNLPFPEHFYMNSLTKLF